MKPVQPVRMDFILILDLNCRISKAKLVEGRSVVLAYFLKV
jgi:hypothetical protein